MIQRASNFLKESVILVILYGLLRQIIYYTSFKVPIKYFLSLTDLWFALINEIFLIGPLIIVFIWGYNSSINNNNKSHQMEPNPSRDTELNTQPLTKIKIFKLRKVELVLYASILLFGILCIYYSIISTNYATRFLFILTSLLAFLQVLLFKTLSRSPISEHIYTHFCLVMTLFMIAFVTNHDVSRVKRGLYSGTKIITKDSIYNTSVNVIFLGMTERYAIIHNLKDTSNVIIPLDAIQKIEMKMK